MKVGFLGMLALLFITLKLTGYITWSWWLVLLPIYIGVLAFIGVFILMILTAVFCGEMKSRRRK